MVKNKTAVVESRKVEGERLLGQDWGHPLTQLRDEA